MRAKLIAFLLGALVVQQNYAAAAVGYAFQDLGIPEPLSKLQRGANGGGINDAGEIVVTTDSVGNLRSPQAYRYSSGGWQQLPPLGSDPALPYKIATGINNSGDIVGGSMIGRDSNDQPTYTPVMWQGSSVTDLAPTGLTQANAINDAGTIMSGNSVYVAGSLQALGFTARALNNNNEVVGFLPTPSISLPYYWSPVTGAQQLFPLQPNQTASLTDINDGGIVTGWTNTNATFDHAFYYDGAVHDLNSLIDGNRSQAFGINNAGAIVGSSDRGFWVYKGGQVLFLADYLPDRPDFGPRLLQNFLGINNAGQILLAGTDNGDPTGSLSQHVYLFTPVPAPSAFALGLLALALFGAVAGKRRRVCSFRAAPSRGC